MKWNIFTYIVFISSFIIGTNTWLCICYFLQSNECVKWNFILNIAMRKVWRSYNIITVWCIQIILFIAVEVWVNSSKCTLLRDVHNFPALFLSWRRKHHIYLFYFWKIFFRFNRSSTWKLMRRAMSLSSSIYWSCEQYNDQLYSIKKK